MRTLYRVMMKRLWQDKFMRILAVLALLWGVYTGLETGAARKYQYLYVDDFYFNMAMVFFSGSFAFASFFGMRSVSTPCSSFALISSSVISSPT